MNKYESVVIIDPAVAEEKVKELSQKFTDIINNDGKVEKVEELGKKRLAYEVMNKYESVIIINPSIEEQAIKDLVTKFTDLINNNGKVESVDERGTQKLAYPIKKKEEGYYVVINFEAKPDSIDELERNYRIEDNIMKFIVVRKEK